MAAGQPRVWSPGRVRNRPGERKRPARPGCPDGGGEERGRAAEGTGGKGGCEGTGGKGGCEATGGQGGRGGAVAARRPTATGSPGAGGVPVWGVL